MTLTNRVALITGGKRIGAAVARALAADGASVALVYNRSRDEADEVAAVLRADGRRALTLQADLSEPEACTRVVDATVQELGPSGRPGEHGLALQGEAVRRAHRWRLGRAARRGPARRVPVRACRCTTHAPAGRRPHRELRRLGGRQRKAALPGLRAVLRGQAGRHRAHRSAGARTGRGSDPGERRRPRTDRRHRRAPASKNMPPWRRPRPSAGGAAKGRSRRRCDSWWRPTS